MVEPKLMEEGTKLQVGSDDATSNQVLFSLNDAAPGPFSTDGGGVGTGCIRIKTGP